MFKYLVIIFFCMSCSSIPEKASNLHQAEYPNHIIKTEHLAIKSFIPRETMHNWYEYTQIEFDGENTGYKLYLDPSEDYFIKEELTKIKTHYDSLYITYHKEGDKFCFNSIRFNNKEYSSSRLNKKCSQFLVQVSKKELAQDGYSTKVIKNEHSVETTHINKFIENNPKYKKFKNLALSKVIQIGMPLELFNFMMGNSEIRGVYNENEHRKVDGWYIFVRDSKIISFSREEYPTNR